MERDFPENTPKLPKSLKAMGVSRADLWHFASLVGLNDFLLRTKAQCSVPDVYTAATCKEFPCYIKPFDNILKMFKTGRKDCKPRRGTSKFKGYLTSSREETPDPNQGGEATTDWFRKHIKLEPRESLALLGVHTIGHFNGMSAHLNYGWVNALTVRINMFNNEYYRLMAQRDSKPKCKSVSKLADPNAVDSCKFQVQPTVFTNSWPAEDPWATKDRNGLISWILVYFTKAKEKGASNHSRMLTCEMGYFWNFTFTGEGLPTGCNVFKGTTSYKVRDAAWYRDHRSIGYNDCNKQMMPDEHGLELHKAVDLYADDGDTWIKDFVDAYTKMYENGWSNLEVGSSNFWTHRCKLIKKLSIVYRKYFLNFIFRLYQTRPWFEYFNCL